LFFHQNSGNLVPRKLPESQYCSLLPDEEGREQLVNIGHLLELLYARLLERNSPYATLFLPLMHFAGIEETDDAVRKRVATDGSDDTPQAIDHAWNETPVTFDSAPEVCRLASSTHNSVTVQWVNPQRAADISS
jgi:nitrate reductase delta subunit